MEKAKILYLDDDANNIEKFTATFQPHYGVFVAASPSEATNILEKKTIGVIVAHQGMKGMDVIKFFETIIPEFPDPIRIIISDSNDAQALINAINQGQVFRYISNGSDLNELKQSVSVAMKIFLLLRKKHEQISQMREESLKGERILNLFSRHVPKHILQQTLSKDSQNLFGGELRHITVLFAAISNLTQMTDSIDPNKTFQYLNRFFSLITRCVEEHKGTLDKIIGDHFLALFGAPVSYLNDEKNAVFCALNIFEKLKKFNQEQTATIGFETKVCVGIHSGNAIIGHIGSHQYISYTAVGDTVNTAARILDIAKKTPSSILVSESVYNAVKDDFVVQSLGEQNLRGKEQPVSLYQVTGKAPQKNKTS